LLAGRKGLLFLKKKTQKDFILGASGKMPAMPSILGVVGK